MHHHSGSISSRPKSSIAREQRPESAFQSFRLSLLGCIVITVTGLIALYGCDSGDGGSSSPTTDTDIDTDSDSDTDNDSDTDVDSDSDTDSDSDADTDSDSDSDGDTDQMALTNFCNSDGWCWENPTPHGNQMQAVWIGGEDDVWLSGDGGMVLRFDGTDWYEWRSDNPAESFTSIWGTGPTDMYALSSQQLVRYNGETWSTILSTLSMTDIYGFATDDIWVAGYMSARHWNGTTWQEHELTTGVLHAIFGVASDDIWVGGQEGALFHFDGNDWEDHTQLDAAQITGIWGSATDDVYFTRTFGEPLLHWNGSVIEEIDPGLSTTWYDISGTGSDDVWIVGWGPTVAHFDGLFWTDQSPEVSTVYNFNAVGAAEGEGPWVVGMYGFYCERQGSDWSCSDSLTYSNVASLWGASYDAMTAMDAWGVVATRDADGWTGGYTPETYVFADIWQFATDDAWGYRYDYYGDQLHFYNWDGDTWTEYDVHVPRNVRDVWIDDDGQGWAVGLGGEACHFDGSSWTCHDSGTTYDLRAVWGIAAEDVWAVGENGTVVHWNGSDWSPMAIGTTSDLTAVWGAAENDIWVSEYWGELYHYTGSWAEVPVAGLTSASSIYGFAANDVWAVGYGGEAFHYDGVWTEVDTTIYDNLYTVWGAATNDVWAVGEHGALIHWEGTEWIEDVSIDDWYTEDLGGVDANNVWVVSRFGGMYHYDGSGWAEVTNELTEDSTYFRKFFGVTTDNLWIVDDNGRSYSYDGAAWTRQGFEEEDDALVTDVWVAGEDDAWATVREGLLLHFDGIDWKMHSAWGATQLDAIHGQSASQIWAMGDVILEYDGGSWTRLVDITEEIEGSVFVGMYGASSTEIQGLLNSGRLHTWDGDSLNTTFSISDYSYYVDAHFLGIDEVWAAGHQGAILYWDGTLHEQERVTSNYLISIHATPDGHVYTGGAGGTILHRMPE